MSHTSSLFLKERRQSGGSIHFQRVSWASLVGGVDTLLRRHYHVYEFSDETTCLFRVALTHARHPVAFADGTVVEIGEPIGVLHFWNEHILHFPEHGPDLHWAKAMQHRMRRSLRLLCNHVERDPDWADVKAIVAEAAMPTRSSAGQQMQRLARRHGFEVGAADTPARGRLYLIAENILRWGFVRAYNPGALPRCHLLQGRQELWLTRRSLLAHYGGGTQRCRPAAAIEPAFSEAAR